MNERCTCTWPHQKNWPCSSIGWDLLTAKVSGTSECSQGAGVNPLQTTYMEPFYDYRRSYSAIAAEGLSGFGRALGFRPFLASE